MRVADPQREHRNVLEDRLSPAIAGRDWRRWSRRRICAIGKAGMKGTRAAFAQPENDGSGDFRKPSKVARAECVAQHVVAQRSRRPLTCRSPGISCEKAMMNSASVTPVFSK
jgi:hypothetical protein